MLPPLSLSSSADDGPSLTDANCTKTKSPAFVTKYLENFISNERQDGRYIEVEFGFSYQPVSLTK